MTPIEDYAGMAWRPPLEDYAGMAWRPPACHPQAHDDTETMTAVTDWANWRP